MCVCVYLSLQFPTRSSVWLPTGISVPVSYSVTFVSLLHYLGSRHEEVTHRDTACVCVCVCVCVYMYN